MDSPEKTQTYRETNAVASVRSSLDYVPYTLREYEAIRPTQYQELGGLGPALGSEEWKRQKEARDRRIEYSRLVHDVNSQRLPGTIALMKDRDRKKLSTARDAELDYLSKLSRRVDSADT